MTNTEAAWLAGIIDGEGTLLISEYKPRTNAGGINPTFEAIIAVVNTDNRITNRCHELAGGCVFGPVGRGKPGVWKPAYRWSLKRQKAATAVREILPYLVSKREQATVFLKLVSLIKSGSLMGNCGVIQHTSNQIQDRRDLRHALQALNHRGASAIPTEQANALAKVRDLIAEVVE